MISNPFLFYFFIVVLAMIYKFFLKKGGIQLKLNGIFPQKTGIREKESKWAPLVSNIVLLAVLIFLIDMFMRFIQQEAEKIYQ
ncbi:MAG: hypothetical protein H0V39_05090 [Nitrosomonas sp.]|nr:hypothetical protein [Nitrosomonas sp.]